MQSPHDQLFHYTFSQPEHAAALLRSTLPAEIAAAIDWSTLTPSDGKLTDGENESLFADLLFTVSVGSRVAYVLLLLEHKSEADPRTAFQLLRYLVRIWERHEGPLPPILTVVLHHGRTPWRGPRSLRDLIDVADLPAEFARAVLDRQPDFTFHLDDLATQSEAHILTRVHALFPRLALLCMQFLRNAPEDEAEAALRGWHGLLAGLYAAEETREAFLKLVEYIATITRLRRDRVRRIFAAVHPDAEQTYMKTYGRLEEEALQKGMAIGEAKGVAIGEAKGVAIGEAKGVAIGEAKGLAKGRAELLLRQLHARFGPPDEATVARVHTATPADIELWAIAVLSAPTLAAVFEAG